ncbi:MAG: T9SS type A sorting domain-containing protein [Bacteroidota bacterium]|nr:T9SS type A sorting domain-containing protein [Bacteroidota bacterium]
MKRYLFIVTLLLASTALRAQSLNLLTDLHPRPQVSFFKSSGHPFVLDRSTVIVMSDSATSGTLKAVQFLQRTLREQFGDTLSTLLYSSYLHVNSPKAILIGEYRDLPSLRDSVWAESGHGLIVVYGGQSYELASSESKLQLCGQDSDGTFYSVATAIQLFRLAHDTIPSLFIFDYPDYPIRWVFSAHNLMVPAQVSALETIEDSMAAHKLNGLQQNDFKYSILDRLDSYYYGHVDSMRVHAEQNNIEVIPGVCTIGWSQAELLHDPDMAEGFPTTCRYVIKGDTGQLVGDPRVALPNGNFENATGNTFPGWGWVDTTVHVDNSVVHNGRFSARVENFGNNAPNGRFIKLLTCSPHHGYHMSAWVKTQNFRGEFNLLAIGFHGGSSRTLTFTQFGIPSTSDWQQANVIFNTLDYDSLYVYCGVWSGSAGTIWMDDYQIEEAGMTNLLHRADELPVVTGPAGKYAEGTDYAPIIDSIMEQSNGSYSWHTPPTLHIPPGSRIHNGDSVSVSFIRANPVLNDVTGDGSTMVCVSEDTLYSIMHDQIYRVDSLLHRPNRYFISHDEIRQMNWDSACNRRQLTPAQLLADNATKCDSIVTHVHPAADIFDWSDMFDSLHNARNNYYLVNGDLSGDWDKIPKNITIVNWNGGYMSQSLDFFAKHGFSQITSPYYDVQNTNNMRAWRLAMDTIPNMRGMMYTTWAADYSFLTPFADYAWSAGPMIVHTPLALGAKITDGEYVPVNANVFADPYDPTDTITKVTYIQYDKANGKDQVMSIKMVPDTGHYYRCTNLTQGDPGTDVTYEIRATDKNGITRTTPRYLIIHIASDGVQAPALQDAISIYPNPTNDRIVVTIPNGIPQSASIQILNSVGAVAASPYIREEGQISIDTHSLPAGAYNLILKTGAETITKPFVILR